MNKFKVEKLDNKIFDFTKDGELIVLDNKGEEYGNKIVIGAGSVYIAHLSEKLFLQRYNYSNKIFREIFPYLHRSERSHIITLFAQYLKDTRRASNSKDIRTMISHEYNIKPGTVGKYLSMDYLSKELKRRLDTKELSIPMGNNLAYLKVNEQEMVNDFLAQGYEMDYKKASGLRTQSRKAGLTKENIKKILEQERR